MRNRLGRAEYVDGLVILDPLALGGLAVDVEHAVDHLDPVARQPITRLM